MKFGLDITPAGPWGEPGTIAELASLAEERGWDGVFCEDYLTFPPDEGAAGPVATYDVWITLALVAQATSRVLLGTMVTPLPLRHVATVAVQALTVDRLSGGRLALGVGSGDPDPANLAAAGSTATARERAQRLDVSLATLTRLWDAELRPSSLARPRIPIWVGGALTRPGPRRRALRWDGSCLYRIPTEHGWEDVTPDDVRALRADARAGFTILVGGRERATEPDGLAADRRYVAAMAEAGADWFQEYVPPRLSYDEARRRIEAGPLVPAALFRA
jgi:alkanesulfonate monooxygenase SsuD/methylene tetrahydromethanopterin reductase-like flavin-dependent oxidoreductase (luciferase family)